ncbi:GNAT family protein [Rarobacter faecitabidus]|uniref:Ribosomal-protein-alanine N-acetyltransferase n=1 Tax=Rarobacter faecitabidus TaxID=13243 RepID=A0A542ZTQ5_RARFA|nr:GNAT family protein [Rarobacter faecitabidus]TQL63735.1 ribosomal-protein-alanine N-acetyltransferase [Rarobacter faecitabidus]
MHWPLVIREDLAPPSSIGSVLLRPLRRGDGAAWDEVRRANSAWLAPWEPSDPEPTRRRLPTFGQYVRELARQGRNGTSLPLAIEVDGELAGQITAGNLVWGAQKSGMIGYWVSEHLAGRGIAPLATAMLIDTLFAEAGLHRVEVCIRPENLPSRRAIAKLGLRSEGTRPRYVHIDGDWRDHLVFAIDTSEWAGPGDMVGRWRAWRGANYTDVI